MRDNLTYKPNFPLGGLSLTVAGTAIALNSNSIPAGTAFALVANDGTGDVKISWVTAAETNFGITLKAAHWPPFVIDLRRENLGLTKATFIRVGNNDGLLQFQFFSE